MFGLSIIRPMTARKKLQRIGNSRMLVIDRNILSVFLPDDDLDQELVIEVRRGELIVRPAKPLPAELDGVGLQEAAASLPPLAGMRKLDRRLVRILEEHIGNTTELAAIVADRSVPTVSLALNRLLRAGWARKTGRDWHLSDAARQRVTK